MKTLIFASVIAAGFTMATAAVASPCGLRAESYIGDHETDIEGNWKLEWTKGLLTVSGRPQAMETLPPTMVMSLSLEVDHLQLRGEIVKRDFAVYWDQTTQASFDPREDDPDPLATVNTQEMEILYDCKVEDMPFLRGQSVGTGKGPVTDLYLWMASADQMVGLSVAETGPATARLQFVLTRE